MRTSTSETCSMRNTQLFKIHLCVRLTTFFTLHSLSLPTFSPISSTSPHLSPPVLNPCSILLASPFVPPIHLAADSKPADLSGGQRRADAVGVRQGRRVRHVWRRGLCEEHGAGGRGVRLSSSGRETCGGTGAEAQRRGEAVALSWVAVYCKVV